MNQRGILTLGQWLSFLMIGVVGFAVDAGVLTLLMTGAQWGPVEARAVSFLVAVTVTWRLNRRLTFAARNGGRLHREYAGYLVVQTLGAALNLSVFLACLVLWPGLRAMPVVPLAVGSLLAMVFNFSALKWLVYR